MSGYKTYLIGFVLVIVAGCHSLGYINDDLYKTLEGVLTGGGLIALRAGIAKGNK